VFNTPNLAEMLPSLTVEVAGFGAVQTLEIVPRHLGRPASFNITASIGQQLALLSWQCTVFHSRNSQHRSERPDSRTPSICRLVWYSLAPSASFSSQYRVDQSPAVSSVGVYKPWPDMPSLNPCESRLLAHQPLPLARLADGLATQAVSAARSIFANLNRKRKRSDALSNSSEQQLLAPPLPTSGTASAMDTNHHDALPCAKRHASLGLFANVLASSDATAMPPSNDYDSSLAPSGLFSSSDLPDSHLDFASLFFASPTSLPLSSSSDSTASLDGSEFLACIFQSPTYV
jgi:hypothetical protein